MRRPPLHPLAPTTMARADDPPQPSWWHSIGARLAAVPWPWAGLRRERRWADAQPELALQLARELRTGAPLEAALIEVSALRTDAPTRFVVVARSIEAGHRLGDALDRWSQTAVTDTERTLIAALTIAASVGAQAAAALESIAGALRDDLDLDRRRRILLIQAQLSAAVLVALPIGFAVSTSVTRGEFLYGSGLGPVLLIAGLLLDGIGVLWMRRLMRRLS